MKTKSLSSRIDWHLTKVPYRKRQHSLIDYHSGMVGRYRELDLIVGPWRLMVTLKLH